MLATHFGAGVPVSRARCVTDRRLVKSNPSATYMTQGRARQDQTAQFDARPWGGKNPSRVDHPKRAG